MISSTTHTYKGTSEINFHTNENDQLAVTIETQDLFMRSIKEADIKEYVDLFGNAEVMKNYADGKPREKEAVIKRINESWIKRWDVEKDPYSAIAVFEKESKKFIGHVILGHGDNPGEAELAGLELAAFWHKGYGRQAASAIIEYAKATVAEGYNLDGATLYKITATTLEDNKWAVKILDKLGKEEKKEEKYGEMRLHYAIKV